MPLALQAVARFVQEFPTAVIQYHFATRQLIALRRLDANGLALFGTATIIEATAIVPLRRPRENGAEKKCHGGEPQHPHMTLLHDGQVNAALRGEARDLTPEG